MREFGVRRLLHGHTHRPGIHDFTLDGRPAQRIVLGAWHDRPSFVRWDKTGPRLT
jgi:UDP-2,3-diacylglucosamine hydrolase